MRKLKKIEVNKKKKKYLFSFTPTENNYKKNLDKEFSRKNSENKKREVIVG